MHNYHRIEPAPYYQDDTATIYTGDMFDVLPILKDVDAFITDPPYSSGGMFKADRSKPVVSKYVQTGTQAFRPEFEGDNRDQRSFFAWSTLWLTAAWHATRPGGHLMVFTDWRQLPTTTDAVQAAGWLWQGIEVWHKTIARPRPNAFRADSEFIVWATKGPQGKQDNKTATYLNGVFPSQPPKDRFHTTQKPIPVMEWLCSLLPEGSTIADPFMGSGSTLVAARNLGHKVIGCELSEPFADHTIERLQTEVQTKEGAA